MLEFKIYLLWILQKILSPTMKRSTILENLLGLQNHVKAHIKNTSQEIFEQTNGKIDGFICSVGTGGTLAGVSIGLKQRNSNIKIGLADPDGSALFKHYTDGILKSEGSSITEGIGQGRITKNLEGLKPDFSYNIKDDEALKIIYSLIIEEGLSLGTSSGINICGAIKMGKELGPGHTIVTILCDHSQRYKSKLFNIEFLKERNLPIPVWFKNENQDLPDVSI